MICPRCRSQMVEQKRVYHRQRKWICPDCQRVRFQRIVPRKRQTKAKK
ncbi:MAG: hypothetical protein AB1792_04265 [Candidatus Zixiibacteriota bacterium]